MAIQPEVIKDLYKRRKAIEAGGGDDKIAVLIAGDKETQYKNVIEVLDEVKRSGFQRVALETASK